METVELGAGMTFEAIADYRLIWSMPAGTPLCAHRDLRLPSEGAAPSAVGGALCGVAGTRAGDTPTFKKGRTYEVETMHPIFYPPYVCVRDDSGQLQRLVAAHIRYFFGKPQ
ncbi:hypothetical protein ACTHR6_24590 [Ralstonia holmesii]|uniref:hypothetical protein n=1 Tax=Ralstonia TaxID=48736 RepID=UPI000469D701|nr:hypothetical protein [Ralstonia pickettii]